MPAAYRRQDPQPLAPLSKSPVSLWLPNVTFKVCEIYNDHLGHSSSFKTFYLKNNIFAYVELLYPLGIKIYGEDSQMLDVLLSQRFCLHTLQLPLQQSAFLQLKGMVVQIAPSSSGRDRQKVPHPAAPQLSGGHPDCLWPPKLGVCKPSCSSSWEQCQ